VPGDGGVYEPLARRGFGATLGLDGRIFVAGGTAGGSEQTRFEAFTPATGKWEKLSDLPATRTELLLAAGNNGRLYALLGFQNLWLSDLVTAYDVDGRTWSTESPAPIARAHVAGASMGMGGGPIYVFGGLREAGGDTDQVWSFDAMSGMWSSHSPMPDTRYDFAAANLVADQFYLIGGTGGMGDLDSVLLYAAFSDRWSVPPMGARLASPRSDLAAAAARNATGIMIVVALGGRRHEQVLDTVEILDTTTGWRSGTPMPVPRAAFAAVTGPDGRHVYVIGGTDGSGRDINRVDIYDAGSDSWSTP
jgi:N-acetylneuraminic acid mutarotase